MKQLREILDRSYKTDVFSDTSKLPKKRKDFWGFHLLIDMASCNNKIDDEKSIEQFFSRLIKILDMKILSPLMIKRVDNQEEGRGVSAVQMITTSSITLHTDMVRMCGYLDVFSCKDFEQQKVIKFVEEFFNPQRISHKLIYREA